MRLFRSRRRSPRGAAPPATPRRAPRHERHPNGDIYYTVGRWWYTPDMWNRFVSEGRGPDADHDFQRVTGIVEEAGVPAQWGRVRVVCRRCGEERLVYHSVDLRTTNLGWCVGPWDHEADVVDVAEVAAR